MILITDVREKIAEAKNMINRLDTVTPQIMISARVVEVSKDFSRELGIEWGVSSKDVYRDDLGGTYGFDVAMNYPATSNSSLSYTFNRIVGTPFSINAKLTAAEAKGDVKIVSSPRILTMDNKKASIKQGIEYAYLERDDTGGSSVKFKDIDLLLEVTPHVTPDKRVTMTVHITKNDLDSITDGIPSLSTNEAETELLVNDGNTIVIGGIVKTSTTDSSTGFPLLSDIPVLGHLFRSDKDTEKKNELLIFLTPTIVQLDQKMQN
jgi:type IV pilus assembly protein PilQ